jgi:predicted protein tyrosine phosphatase
VKEKIKVLAVCSKGLNRSKYLAEYLGRKGYKTRYGGAEGFEDPNMKWNPISQEDVDWADIIITVRKRLKDVLQNKFNIGKNKFIEINVTDSKRLIPEALAHLKELDYISFQKKWTYPQLRKAIKPFLPLKIK